VHGRAKSQAFGAILPETLQIRLLQIRQNRRISAALSAFHGRLAIEELKLGKAKRFYRMISARRFACCHEAEAENQPDWDAADEVNAGVVIKCEWKNGNLQCK
ncbi:hypothetical protein H7F50_19300, partial [Novosphingobium flavum]|uniref:hypothetical protein n=1 Tax=Novosphingobium aerophilum TaxID=2839843 RepID=UPI00163AA958